MMNNLFNIQKDHEFCILITENNDAYHIKITEFIETDDIDIWVRVIKHIYQKSNFLYHYYLGSDNHYTILNSLLPENKNILHRKSNEDLSLDKLIKKFRDNQIELPSDHEYLKGMILSDDIKIDALKLVAYFQCYYFKQEPKGDGVFKYVQPSEKEVYKPSLFGESSLQDVLKHFD